ncbi:MAG: hypothetical protein ACTHLC_11525 [Rhizobiaceae bacterium]
MDVAAMRRFPQWSRPGFMERGNALACSGQETKMARRGKRILEMSPEADQVLQRITALAHRLGAGLAGEALSAEGRVDTEGAAALVAAMFLFLLSISPDDLHALFFADGSMAQFAFRPWAPERPIPPLFAGLFAQPVLDG